MILEDKAESFIKQIEIDTGVKFPRDERELAILIFIAGYHQGFVESKNPLIDEIARLNKEREK